MRTALLYFLVFGVGFGGLFWLVWDYIRHLRRQLIGMQDRVRELEAKNAELILALEERRDMLQIDEAIRRGRPGSA